MPFNLLLLPLLGGFLFFSHWNRTKFFAKRQDKERLLLYSSLWGVVFLAISFGASIVIPHIPVLSKLQHWWAYNTPAIQFSGISSFALALGALAPCILNYVWPFSRIWPHEKVSRDAIFGYGGPLEQLLYRAIDEQKSVMVTLKSGKVYVGRVIVSLAPQDDTGFYLLQTRSGYRESEKQRLVITTNYDDVYRRIVADEKENALSIISDFGVVIPVKEVVSATLYQEDVHTKYFPHGESEQLSLPPNTPPVKP